MSPWMNELEHRERQQEADEPTCYNCDRPLADGESEACKACWDRWMAAAKQAA